jgi:hypothetical protein
MAIRTPAIDNPSWLFQEFLEDKEGTLEYRVLQVKYDGNPFNRVSETFDYSNPPFTDDNQRGGPIVAEIQFSLEGKLVTILDWCVNWRDEWPLRLGVNCLIRCRYRPTLGYVVRVDKEVSPFWISEQFNPYDKSPNSYLVH